MSTLRERVREKINGLAMSIECERAVIAHLTPYREEFRKMLDARALDHSAYPENHEHVNRGMRVLLESEKQVRDWNQEREDWISLLNHLPAEVTA